MESGFSIWHLLIILFSLAMLYPYVRIVQKAGYSGWWVLTGLVPVLNFIMLWVFALSTWPVERGGRPDDGFVD
ncbi:DUF805 domain-containing protein [Dongia rigui]|uniref:DUF805 domain-containing protein n=1 Tax=Dongia rigui TaxID=940149 RepID=A0ABU5E422_9PROT|nr:hypothetical protein [Dongia rigui]MDY0874388.1 hypothetical protein [Dongia rigui]